MAPIISTFGSGSAIGFGRAQFGFKGFAFTSATFTPGGSTGRTGPSLSEAQNGISSSGNDSWKNDTEFFNVTNGLQEWTVPASGSYTIEVWGAEGGSSTFSGGKGARMRGDFELESGEVIYIVVGQKGDSGSYSGGGGGGTFVWRNSRENYSLSDLIIAAGGGAGGAETGPGIDGTTAELGTYGDPSAGNDAASNNWTRRGPGESGMFEQSAENGRNYASGPGAGFMSSFRNPEAPPPVGSYSNDLNCDGSSLGGNSGRAGEYDAFTLDCNGLTQPSGPWIGGERNSSDGGHGGFGGGGGSATSCGGSGAGGGYSGGNSSGCDGTSGGGGSFNSGSNQFNSSGVRSGNGQVTITSI
jgi:hypothetical protein